MERMGRAMLPALKVAHGRMPTRTRVVQFGEGGFLRAFVDAMIDAANEKADMDAGVAVVQPIPRGLVEELRAQDGLYTLILRGRAGGQDVNDARVITCVRACVDPYADFDAFLALARDPDVRFVVSNTTEAGIVYTGRDALDDRPQASFPGKLTRLLYERFTAFGGARDKGLVLLPVELIDDNGARLKACVVQTATQWGLGEAFTRWLDEACVFTSTLVDRIVTGYPRQEAQALCAGLGYEDRLLDAAEPFGQWVIEGPAWLEDELPLRRAGQDVRFTQDVRPYKLRKVRMLNGAHTATALIGYLAGLDTVGECMADAAARRYVERALYEEIMPTLDLPRDELEAFAAAILERFQNPYNRHELLSIALNSQSKLRARVLPTIRAYWTRRGALPRVLTFSVGAFLAFYCGADGAAPGLRADGTAYAPVDDADVLAFFEGLRGLSPQETARAALSNAALWGEDLTALPGLADAAAQALSDIRTLGARRALDAIAG